MDIASLSNNPQDSPSPRAYEYGAAMYVDAAGPDSITTQTTMPVTLDGCERGDERDELAFALALLKDPVPTASSEGTEGRGAYATIFDADAAVGVGVRTGVAGAGAGSTPQTVAIKHEPITREAEESSARKRKASSDTDHPAKKVSKKSRTLFSKSRRRQRKRAASSFHAEQEAMGTEVMEDPSKMYCYCQLPYDEDLFYIQCDECNQWYCSKCTFLKESQLDSIILFFCIPCETVTGKKTVRRRLCAAYEYAQKLEMELEDALDDTSSTTGSQAPAAANNNGRLIPLPLPLRTGSIVPLIYTQPRTCKTHVPHENDAREGVTALRPVAEEEGAAAEEKLQETQESKVRVMLETPRPLFYCSEACGVSLAAHRLSLVIAPPGSASAATAAPGAAQASEAAELGRKECKLLSKALARRTRIERVKEKWVEVERCHQVVEGATPGPVITLDPRSSVAARNDAEDLERLRRLQTQDGLLKRRLLALQTWLRLVDDAMELCHKYELELARKESGEGLPLCGFDTRLVRDWVVPSLKEWVALSEGERDAFVQRGSFAVVPEKPHEKVESEPATDQAASGWSEAGLDVSHMCLIRGKCTHHIGWKILRVAEVETEINLGMQDLEKNNQAMQRLIDQMHSRRRRADEKANAQ